MAWHHFALLIGSLVLLYLASRGMGSHVSFGGKEKPERLLGSGVALLELEGLGPSPPDAIEGVVTRHSASAGYTIQFLSPQPLGGNVEAFAIVTARHVGYPVSKASRWGSLAVAGYMESGAPFIALIRKVRKPAVADAA